MRFELRLDPREIRAWHLTLLERVSRRPGAVATASLACGQGARDLLGGALLGLDRALFGRTRALMAPVAASLLARYARNAGDVPDIILDLCADGPGEGAARCESRVWRLTFGGADHEAVASGDALLRLLLQGASPVARVREADQVVAAARLGAEFDGSLLSALEDYLSRTVTLIEAALSGTARALTTLAEPGSAAPPGITTIGRAAKTASRQLVGSAMRRMHRVAFVSPHWCVGWRRLDGPDVLDLRAHPQSGWRVLPDDGHRFYADPFPIEHDGSVTVFVEEYLHRTGKGVISAVRFDADGPVGRPEQVLELPYHLSYPYVFAHDGEVWMVPESSVAGSIDLFRATRFPGGWVKAATLVGGVVASDATLVEHDGRWWMFATVRDGGGAFSDALHLWWAEDFRGPWTSHPANPVLIDVAAARPAGRMVVRRGQLFRPVQDCRRGYGRALAIARVTRLDETGFEQVSECTLTAGPLWPGSRLHTLNSAGGFEFIDGSRRVRRRFRGDSEFAANPAEGDGV